MEIEQELSEMTPPDETFLTIGVFDGVHAGHRYLLGKLKQRAIEENLLSGVVTFNPHPQSVLRPQNHMLWLSDIKDRVRSIKKLGIDIVVILSFTPEISRLSAREFTSLLKKHLKMRGMLVGPDFVMGQGREGNIDLLRSLGREMEFTVETLSPFIIDGEAVSSTLIRQALAQGDMRKAEKLMGHHFYLKDRVTTADKRGQDMGFPTANLDVKPQQSIPENGVYATITHVNGKHFPSATNIGTRPTFGNGRKTVETHLIDYKDDLYDKEIKVEFVQKLRDEQRFASSRELTAQIRKDIREVKTILSQQEEIPNSRD